jgi:hypothetical protein
MSVAEQIAQYVSQHPDQIGPPVDNGGGAGPHLWDGMWVQDFAGRGESAHSTAGSAPGRVIVVVGPGGPRLVRNDFYNVYLGGVSGAPAHGLLGAPREEEHGEGGLAVQRFERGRLLWSPLTGTRIERDGTARPFGFVGRTHTSFSLNGRRYKHVGANAPGLIYDTRGDAASDLAKMRVNGIEQVRVFLANDRFSTGEMVDRLRACADESERQGVKLTVALTGNYSRDFFNPEARGGHFFPAGDGHFLTNLHGSTTFTHEWFVSGYRNNYLPLVRSVVAALKDHRGIFAWEIGNELQDREGVDREVRQPFVDFNRRVAAAIREIGAQHLITTGMLSCGHNQLRPAEQEALYGDPNIDYVTVHMYNDNAGELADMNADVALAQALGKPAVIEEVGFSREAGFGDPAAKMGQFFEQSYARPMVGAVMLWGLQFDRDHGNGDARFGPRELGQLEEFMELTRGRASALQLANTVFV